jgi:hypothetical protein
MLVVVLILFFDLFLKMQPLKKITTNASNQQATCDDVDGMWGFRNEGDMEARDGGQQVQASVENALAPSMINEEQVQASVDVVGTSTTNVIRIEVDFEHNGARNYKFSSNARARECK